MKIAIIITKLAQNVTPRPVFSSHIFVSRLHVSDSAQSSSDVHSNSSSQSLGQLLVSSPSSQTPSLSHSSTELPQSLGQLFSFSPNSHIVSLSQVAVLDSHIPVTTLH